MKYFQAINLSEVVVELDSAQTLSCPGSCQGVSNEVVVVVVVVVVENDAAHVER